MMLGAWLSACSRSDVKRLAVEAELPEDGPIWFEDVTDAAGLEFVHDPGPTDHYFMPQIVGSGGAFFDFDGDGKLDIYLVQNGGPKSTSINRLYHQEEDGTFKDVTEGSGLGVAGWGMGVAIGDVNNDGLPDVLLTQYGGIRLFLNKGGGKFEDITEEAELRNPLWAVSAAFLDYNRDGLLDLVVVNYLDYFSSVKCTSSNGRPDYCSPAAFNGVASKLFRNLGPQRAEGNRPAARVRFEDVSLAAGIGKTPGPGLGVVVADFNGDGWPDIFVANDGAANRLWINQKGQSFVDEAVKRGVAYTFMGQAFAGMGVAQGDIDNDGLLDLYVTHLGSETNTLWKQGPAGAFRDATADWKLTSSKWRGTGFGALMADFDNDGFLDIAVVNGGVRRGEAHGKSDFWAPYEERNQLFANRGNGSFVDQSGANKAFSGHFNVGRGLICGDINDDGAPDLLVTSIGGRARLFKNVAPKRGHWLKIRAIDPDLKRDAYGAEITVRAGDRSWFRVLNPAESFLCSSSPIVHIGLGATESISSIDVRWPDGQKQQFPGGGVDRTITLKQKH
jgi:enediyne biosynthesis protein E4